MNALLFVLVCDECARAVFPARAVCPSCYGDRWSEREVAGGTVEHATVHRDVPIASIRTDAGPIVIARCAEPAGTRVRLWIADGAPVAGL